MTQNVTQLRERYKAIQEMIADAQRSLKDILDHDKDDHDNIEDWISERTKLREGASLGERSGQNVPTSPADAETGTNIMESTSECIHLTRC